MLTKVHIQNYRSCKDVLIEDMGSMVALVGRNGAGKTNILKAIQWAAESATSSKPMESEYSWRDEIFPRASLEFFYDQQRYRYEIGTELATFEPELGKRASSQVALDENLSIQGPDGNWMEILNRRGAFLRLAGRDEPIQIGINTPCLPATVALLPSNPNTSRINVVIGYLKTIRYYPLDESNEQKGDWGYIHHDNYENWLANYQGRPDPTTSVTMRLLHMEQEAKEDFKELKELVGSDGLGIIEDIVIYSTEVPAPSPADAPVGSEVDEPKLIHLLSFIPTNSEMYGGPLLMYTDLSLGTRRLLRILVSMIHDRSSVLLLEHPEDGIHAGLLQKLTPLLKTYGDPAQFVITSHSSNVFDQLEPQDVRLVTIENGGTQVRSLTKKEARVAQEFMNEEGSFSEFLETVQED
jgi:energy-coupling factor transporter ATP-binding protein EcfA2